MLKLKKNLLVGTIIVGSLFSNDSIGIEKERRNGEAKPKVRFFLNNTKNEPSLKREEKKPKMKKAPDLSEPQTLRSTGALWRLLWRARDLSNRAKELVKLGELTLDIPEKHREEVAAQCANNDHISALDIPSYLIMRNFIQEPNGRKTTVRRDLEKDSIPEIHNWLNRIASLSKPRGPDTAYNVLSIHNATQEQADEILNAPTIKHLGEVRIWLRPAPSEAPQEGEDKKNLQTIEKREGHSGEVSVQPVLLAESADKKDEKAVVTKEGDAELHSIDSPKKELPPKREEKKPAMKKTPAWSEPQTLKSTSDLRKLLRQAKDLSNRKKQLIKLGELTLDVAEKHREEVAAQCINDDHISTLEIPSYLIMRNFIQEPNGRKTTVRRDLGKKDSMAKLHDWLNHIAKLSKLRGADTPYNVLSIHNATQEQAEEILKAPTITHLGAIRIWLRPASTEAELPPLQEGGDKKIPQTITIEEQERHSVKSEEEAFIQPVPVPPSVDEKDEKAAVTEEEDVEHRAVAVDEDQKSDNGESDASSLGDIPLDHIEQRRGNLLSQLRTFSGPVSEPLVLPQAREYFDEVLMAVRVDMPNAMAPGNTTGQSDEIRDAENTEIEVLPLYPDPIPELVSDLVSVPVPLPVELLPDLKNEEEKDDTERLARVLHQAKFESTLMEIATRKIALHHITKKQSDDIFTDENTDDIETLEQEYQEGEANGEDGNVNVLDEQLYPHINDQLLKRREAPVLEELAQSLEEQAFFDTEKKQDKQDKEVPQGYEGEPILLNWDMTPLPKGIELEDLDLKTDIEVKKPKDPAFPQVRHTSNLVQLYCRSYLRR